MKIQKTDWGSIEWRTGNKEDPSSMGMSVGMVVLEAGKHQAPHVHYDEQMIYILEGNGHSFVNGSLYQLLPGDIFHWPAGIIHENFNTGETPLRHLLVSNPVHSYEEEPEEENQMDFFEPDELARKLYIAVEAIRTQFLETMHYAYAIFDRNQSLVAKSNFFPEFCLYRCSEDFQYDNCHCMRSQEVFHFKEEQTCCCPNGMEVFQVPILFRGNFLGYIQGGYVRQSKVDAQMVQEVYDEPDSAVISIKNLLRKIAKAMRNYCEFDQFRSELSEKEIELSHHSEARKLLVKNLQDAQYAMTDLKINNHFLFNTLNSMASMALEGGIMPLYQSIIDLSKLFHYTLRTKEAMVELSQELEYLKAYLHLQKLRYEEGLTIQYKIDPGLLLVKVPFNFLQPIAENAFTHGFLAVKEKKLVVIVQKAAANLQIKICNSGIILDEKACHGINMGMRSNTAHGLSMVYYKLHMIYGEHFSFQILSDEAKGTRFELCIPYVTEN